MTATRVERDAATERAKELTSINESAKKTLAAKREELASQLEDVNAKLQTIEAEKESAIISERSAIATKDKALQDMAAMETEHTAIFAQLYTETESLKRRLVDATSQITTVLAERTGLVMRIASTLEDDMARILSVKEAALEEARSNIAALKGVGGCGALSIQMTNDSTSNICKASM